MKHLMLVCLLFGSVQAFADEVYECNFTGPNYFLTFHDDESITLKNSYKAYDCLKGYEDFPGSEMGLSVFNCQNKKEKVRFYYGIIDDTIYLSKSLIGSKNIACKKME